MIARRIVVSVPASEERRDAVERAVFERLDAHREALAVPASDDRRDRIERAVFDRLVGIRGAERAERVAPMRTPARRWAPWAGVAGAAMAAAVVAIVAGTSSGGEPAEPTEATSMIIVPPGQTTRFTEGDAVVVAGGDTSVAVTRGANAAVTLTLARGSVDCSVEPRGERAPFQVIAGDVTVTVVGTHFSVRRDDDRVRVDVTHGKVRVTSPDGEAFITAGQTWPRSVIAETRPDPAPQPAPAADTDEVIEMDPQPARRPPAQSSQQAYKAAVKLEASDRASAARAYRQIANGRDSWAPIALADLVRVERDRGQAAVALQIIDEYLRRYPRGEAVEDMLWTRVEIARTPAAAKAYLRTFPAGTYAKRAQRIADTP